MDFFALYTSGRLYLDIKVGYVFRHPAHTAQLQDLQNARMHNNACKFTINYIHQVQNVYRLHTNCALTARHAIMIEIYQRSRIRFLPLLWFHHHSAINQGNHPPPGISLPAR